MSNIIALQPTWEEAYNQFGRKYWSALMTAAGPNITSMANLSRSNRSDVYKKLKRFNVTLQRGAIPLAWDEAYEQFGHKYWTALMSSCGANVCRMARTSGSSRQDVYKKLKRFKVKLPGGSRYGHRGNWGDLSNEEPLQFTA